MQNLQRVIPAFLVAVLVFHVEKSLSVGEKFKGIGHVTMNGNEVALTENTGGMPDPTTTIGHKNGIVTGLLPRKVGGVYTLEELAAALSSVTPESVMEALGLNEDSDTFSIAFIRLLVNQSQKKVNYETAMLILETFASLAPKTVKDLKTISSVIMRLQQEESDWDIKTLMWESLQFFGADAHLLLSKSEMSGWLAADCDMESAGALVALLMLENEDFKALMKRGRKLELLQAIVPLVVQYKDDVLRDLAEARRRETEEVDK